MGPIGRAPGPARFAAGIAATWGACFGWLIALTVFCPFLAPAAAEPGLDLIVRLYYGDRARLDQLASQYDVFEFVDHEAGYVEARLSLAEYDELVRAGYWLEVDETRTSEANRPLELAADQYAGIPGYACYRTVEETCATLAQIASNHPDLAALVDIGDSWEKVTAGGAAGYDVLALVLSRRPRADPPSFRLLIVAEYHAREYSTAETALRFAEELLAGYGVDPDITWILDYGEVHLIPMANPDGRKWAEQGQLWRKNTDSDDGCATFPNYGTDLNRNLGFKWGMAGSSSSPCNEMYRGAGAFSEPENAAVRNHVQSLFPDQRGPGDTDAAPADTTGLVVNLHSYAQLVLYPWAWTNAPTPNGTALRTLAGKFGYFNRYPVERLIDLYVQSGEFDDWVYGELGVPAFTIEMGTAFFQTCASFESTVYPSNRPALLYACKAARRPYLDPAGPDVLQVSVAPATNAPGALTTLTALASSGRSYLGPGTPPAAPLITAARYTVDQPSWVSGVATHAMAASDGNFNSSNELVAATIDTGSWLPGRHIVFVEARTGAGNWGVPTAVFVTVEPLLLTASLEADHLRLQWPSVTNRFYTLLQSDSLAEPFSMLASNLPAQPPVSTFLDPVLTNASRFYRLMLQP
jgi:carboxypeptidase T